MTDRPHVFVDSSLPDLASVEEGLTWWQPAVVCDVELVSHEEAQARANVNEVDTITIVSTGNIRATCPWAHPKADAPPVLAGVTRTAPNRGAVICLDRDKRAGDPRVAAHELGHAMGLHHEDSPADLMYLDALADSVQCDDWWQLAANTLHAPPSRCRR